MQINPSGVGVTQVNGLKPRQSITVGGVEWQLRRDATDASTEFPHAKVNWLNTGCAPIMDGRAHYCWIMGVIAPTTGSVQHPVNVMYVGFHQHRIVMSPNSIAQADLDRMHVYVCNGADFAGMFVNQFLGHEAEPIASRETIAPWPPMIDQAAINPAPVPQPVVAPAPVPAAEVSDGVNE